MVGLVVMTNDEFWRMVAEATARGVAAAAVDFQRQAEAPPALEELLTAEACAKLVGVELRTWRRLESEGQVPRGMRLGSKVARWHPAVVAEWMKTGTLPSAPPEHARTAPAKKKRTPKPNVFEAARGAAGEKS